MKILSSKKYNELVKNQKEQEIIKPQIRKFLLKRTDEESDIIECTGWTTENGAISFTLNNGIERRVIAYYVEYISVKEIN